MDLCQDGLSGQNLHRDPSVLSQVQLPLLAYQAGVYIDTKPDLPRAFLSLRYIESPNLRYCLERHRLEATRTLLLRLSLCPHSS